MTQNSSITLYKWILHEFTDKGRGEFVKSLKPHLAALVQPQDRVLYLCCGGGPFSFLLEELDARVTGIDFASYMIRHAREEALQRRSTVDFIQADVLVHDLGTEQFDLVVFLGNTVLDFPPDNLKRLGVKVGKSLRPGGNLAIHYIDGLDQFIYEKYQHTYVQQEEPERITRRFKAYRPDQAAYIEGYTNETTGELYEYTNYVYTPPYLRLVMGETFDLEQAVTLSARSFFDVFIRR